MSHRFKPAKRRTVLPVSQRGGIEARMKRYAAHIETQLQLDHILAQAPSKEIAEAFLEQVKSYLKFTPRQLQKQEAPEDLVAALASPQL